MSSNRLRSPFPYFGGKSRVASLVWDRIGDVDNFIEPFFGSGAVLLSRPHSPRVETLNDLDCYVANFWRATQHDPEGVVDNCDWPVNEVDLHSRHRWLVLSEDATSFRDKMRTGPGHYDVRFAGWWCWGLCCWIGGGWCAHNDGPGRRPSLSSDGEGVVALNQDHRKPRIDGGDGQLGHGVHAKGDMPKSKVRIAAHNKGSVGKGVHAGGDLHQKRPRSPRAAAGDGPGELPGVHGATLSEQVPMMSAPGRGMDAAPGSASQCLALSLQAPNINSRGVPSTPREGRPQLGDAYALGRGVHANDDAGTCEQRRAWLLDWFGRLRDRLRNVRVCCGHWLRVCDSPSVTTRLGVTGLFLDPPYPTEAKSRTGNLYATDATSDLNKLRDEVLAYCLERGQDTKMRIAICGYDTDGYAKLEEHGWQVEAWKTAGGYANANKAGNDNAARERIWFSPHCRNQRTLFDHADAQEATPVPAGDTDT